MAQGRAVGSIRRSTVPPVLSHSGILEEEEPSWQLESAGVLGSNSEGLMKGSQEQR